jgi:SAM-dependent methyltransferase
MAIMQLSSDNPKFSWILKKNPETGLLITDLRQGKLFSWYSDENTYNVFFKDAADELSYKKDQEEKFEYLNLSRYNSALCIVNMISSLFDHIIKSKQEGDEKGFQNSAFINIISVGNPRYIEFFTKYFEDLTIEYKELAAKNYQLRISSKTTLQNFMNYLNLFVMFYALINKEDIYVNQGILDKYIAMLHQIDAPYFIRYLFKLRFIKTRKLYDQYKKQLEKSDKAKIEIQPETNHQARRTAVENVLDFQHDIVDIGCGEGFFIFKFARKLETNQYIAIDTNEDLIGLLEKKTKIRKMENISTFNSFDNFLENEQNFSSPYDVILSEVIEHMSKERAEALIKQVIDSMDFNNFVITTPNKNFNQYYFEEEEEKRHEDHRFELTEEEFKGWIENIVRGKGYNIEFIQIGDKVDGISTSLGVIIKK